MYSASPAAPIHATAHFIAFFVAHFVVYASSQDFVETALSRLLSASPISTQKGLSCPCYTRYPVSQPIPITSRPIQFSLTNPEAPLPRFRVCGGIFHGWGIGAMLKSSNGKSRQSGRRSVNDKVCDEVCDEVWDPRKGRAFHQPPRIVSPARDGPSRSLQSLTAHVLCQSCCSYPCHGTLHRFLRRTLCRLRFVARLCRDCSRRALSQHKRGFHARAIPDTRFLNPSRSHPDPHNFPPQTRKRPE
jgi:hypothetical protein